ncbi:MAG TPA: hypothetical protein VIG73_01170 [Cerasibacillus sp.]|uniref:hypothetical protein n=1 Tax=Cerasibacillus sp. TaxID=2498711 RepID=UPI002F4114FD
MGKISNLGYINQTMDDFELYLNTKIKEGKIGSIQINDQDRYIIFLSIGNPMIRSRVIKEIDSNFQKAFQRIKRKAIQLVQKNHIDPEWLKIDIVSDIKQISFLELEKNIASTRKNYFRSGIAFDTEFRLAFLEQEINGNAMIRSVKKQPLALDETNINYYMKYNEGLRFPFIKKMYLEQDVYLFKTKAIFKESTSNDIHELYNGELTNGIRKVDNIKEETKHLIEKATYYLMNQVKENGQFEYGYFSAFAKRIGTYNILRHASSLYAMTEGYEVLKDPKILEAIERGLQYLINEAIVYKEDTPEKTAFVVDYANENEIKLGSNATAILAMTKYMEVTKSNHYLDIAQALARGIIHMKLPDEGFIHVLTYPTFSIKALNRIIYYEGEAIFALLRLYAIDRKEQWLEEVKKTFDYFIQHDYWKHHDHWLSYAANELTTYEPDEKYFIFGLKNCHHRLKFIYHRETTFPTFLELTMAAYKMITKIKELQKDELLNHIDESFLIETIDRRAEYQRVGFFYPELAMYMKNPSLIVNGFFIRHHSFRVRIDDVEHYLSGYCQYLHERVPHLTQVNLTISDI